MIEIIILFIILYYVISIYFCTCEESFDVIVERCNDNIIGHFNEYAGEDTAAGPTTETDLKTAISEEVKKLYDAFKTKYDPAKIDTEYATKINTYLLDNLQNAVNASTINTTIPTETLKTAIDGQLDTLLIDYINALSTTIEGMALESFNDKKEYIGDPISTDMKNSILTIIKNASNKVIEKIKTDGTFAPKIPSTTPGDAYLTKSNYATMLKDIYAPAITAADDGYLTKKNYTTTLDSKYAKSTDLSSYAPAIPKNGTANTTYLTAANYGGTLDSIYAPKASSGDAYLSKLTYATMLKDIYAPAITATDDGYLTKKNYAEILKAGIENATTNTFRAKLDGIYAPATASTSDNTTTGYLTKSNYATALKTDLDVAGNVLKTYLDGKYASKTAILTGDYAPKTASTDDNTTLGYLTKSNYATALKDIYAPKTPKDGTADTTYLTAANYGGTLDNKYAPKTAPNDTVAATNYLTKSNYDATIKYSIADAPSNAIRTALDERYAPKNASTDNNTTLGYLTKSNYATALKSDLDVAGNVLKTYLDGKYVKTSNDSSINSFEVKADAYTKLVFDEITKTITNTSLFTNKREYFSAAVKTSFDNVISNLITKIKNYVNGATYKNTIRGYTGDKGAKGDRGDSKAQYKFLIRQNGSTKCLDVDDGLNYSSLADNYGREEVVGKSSQLFTFDTSSRKLYAYDSTGNKKCLTMINSTGYPQYKDCRDRMGDREQYIYFYATDSVTDSSAPKEANVVYEIYSAGDNAGRWNIRNKAGKEIQYAIHLK